MRVSVAQAVIGPEIGHTISAGINTNRVKLISEKLRRHQNAGRIRPDVDLEAIAQSITGLGFAMGFVFQVCFGEDRELARRIILGAAAAICRGIAASPTEERSRS